MSETERLAAILEGHCPDCCEAVKVVKLEGFAEWLLYDCPYSATAEIEVVYWMLARELTPWDYGYEPKQSADIEGAVTFRCPNGHEFYAETSSHGDWAL